MNKIENKILSDITVHMKYARFLPEKNRRETWEELVTRNMNMHIKKFPQFLIFEARNHRIQNFVFFYSYASRDEINLDQFF